MQYKQQYDLMNKISCLLIFFALTFGVSLAVVITLINRPLSENDQTSIIRFKFLIALHLIIVIYVVLIVKMYQIYFMVFTTFATFLLIALSCFICQTIVYKIEQKPNYHFNNGGGSMENLQLAYLDTYFMIYLYSLIGLIPTAIFLLITQVLICMQQYHYNKQKTKYLKKIGYDQELQDVDCSICLLEFNSQDKNNLLQIYACGHTFHEKCLGEWLQYNDICPLDRKKIFEIGNELPQENDH